MAEQKLNLGWALSIGRLIDLTQRDPARVVKPVSPQMVFRPVLLPPKSRTKKRTR